MRTAFNFNILKKKQLRPIATKYLFGLSRLMGKPTICIGEFENKGADQLWGNREADQRLRLMGKPTICIGENKGADQLCGTCNREADQRLCFRYSDSTIPLLLKSEISSF